jgi:integrase
VKTEEKLSPRTLRYMRAVLRAALNDAVKWGIISRNAATLVDLPRAVRLEIRTLDPTEARRFLAAAKQNRVGSLFSVALAVGLRLGEALGLGWQDVDLKAKTLRVRRALQRVDGELRFVEPKSERSRRTVSLPDFAVTALTGQRTAQKKDRLRAGSKWTDSGLVFTTTIGSALDERNVRREFDSILAAAKLPMMRIHDLRHTCASLLLAQGVHPRVVMETLGHSQISLTLDTYSHVLPALGADAAAKMDSLVGVKSGVNRR